MRQMRGEDPPAVKNLSRPPVALATPIPALSSSEVTTSRIFDRLAVVVLGVVGIVALLTFRDYGLSWDDYTHSEYGDLLLKFYLSGLRDQRALSWVNLYYYGGGFDLLAALAAKLLPFTLFETRRLMGAAGGGFGLFVPLGGGPRGGGAAGGGVALGPLPPPPAPFRPQCLRPKGFPLRGCDGDFSARSRANLRRISTRVDRKRRPRRHRLRTGVRIAHHGRVRSDRRARGARVDLRPRLPRARDPFGRRAAWTF